MTNSTANSMAAMSSIVMTSAASSDTMSEISDSGTGTSGRSYSDSREEMHQLATSLGLESADDLAKERFKVDRKKLEAMLHCDGEDGITAVNFFQKVMTDTRTLILWPTRLKIGAKSKKGKYSKICLPILLDSERSDECIDFTMKCVFFVSVTTFWSSKSAPILKSGPCF
ncbi:protein bicaudal C 1 isoform X2 [Aphis craccivora]|uniref:Protein bicaudal C 1 isoform X2 n=1 Tax=Aphis craccivora TaxID=307492 RepID=A0A6G0Z8V5_APHCR|nr:protein bicaudal C 1 isoform X2 [Aphis craccivora]